MVLSAGLAGCSLGGRPSLRLLAWLPSGDLYYEHQNFDGPLGWTLRRPSGATTEVDLSEGYVALGDRQAGCEPDFLPFVSPDGELGLEYHCASSTQLMERDGSGAFRFLGALTPGWGVGWLRSGTTLTGVALGSTSAQSGHGECHGIVPLQSGRVGIPYADLTSGGVTHHVSPPDQRDCAAADNQVTGVELPTARRDGSYQVFLMADDTSERVWWWPLNASQPRPVGPALHGVDALSIDPVNPRVLVSLGLGKGGVMLIDLFTGKTHRLDGDVASDAAFAPDGRSVAYVKDDRLKFAKP
jgi:hypothetical protein